MVAFAQPKSIEHTPEVILWSNDQGLTPTGEELTVLEPTATPAKVEEAVVVGELVRLSWS